MQHTQELVNEAYWARNYAVDLTDAPPDSKIVAIVATVLICHKYSLKFSTVNQTNTSSTVNQTNTSSTVNVRGTNLQQEFVNWVNYAGEFLTNNPTYEITDDTMKIVQHHTQEIMDYFDEKNNLTSCVVYYMIMELYELMQG